MTNIPDGWETIPYEPDPCDLCARDERDQMVYDGWGYGPEPLDEPGTAVSLCDRCQAWAYRVQLAAVCDLEDQIA